MTAINMAAVATKILPVRLPTPLTRMWTGADSLPVLAPLG